MNDVSRLAAGCWLGLDDVIVVDVCVVDRVGSDVGSRVSRSLDRPL